MRCDRHDQAVEVDVVGDDDSLVLDDVTKDAGQRTDDVGEWEPVPFRRVLPDAVDRT